MPRYFIHVEDGVRIADHDGEELADDAAAREAALTTLAEVVVSRSAAFWTDRRLGVAVTDTHGREVVVLEVRIVETTL